MKKLIRKLGVGVLLSMALVSLSHAQPFVKVQKAWARATVPGQTASGVFMTLTARETTKLVGVESAAAGVAEIHEMKVQNGVMTMRGIDSLNLPAGRAVELKPGGFHVMLMDLKAPLAKDATIPLTLNFLDAKGTKIKLDMVVTVADITATAAPVHKH